MITANAMPTFAPVESPLLDFEFDGRTVPVGARDVEEIEVVLELLVLELDVLLLVLLRELEVVDDEMLLVEEGLVEREIVVGVDKITSVIPEMTVVRPTSENSEFTGMVARPVMMTSVTPFMTVTSPAVGAASWEIVAEVIIRYGVPLIVVVRPVIPEGALLRGISVAL